MRSVRLLIPVFLLAASLAAQEPRADQAAGATATAVVPVVANHVGAGMIHWKANVDLINETGAPIDVAIELPAAPDSPIALFTLAPGQLQRFGDILGEAFAVDGVISPLRVTTGAARSVTVNTNIYAVTADGLSPMQPIPTYYGNVYYPIRVLDGLAFSDDLRTNIGLVNLSGTRADFVLALQRIPGRSVAVTHVSVPPNSIRHDAIQAFFPLITKGTGFSVVVETPFAETLVYGSVIENATQGAKYVDPSLGTVQVTR